MTSQARQRILSALAIGVGGVLLFHCLMVLLYNSRPNPVKLRHARFISRYMNPLFTQDWHLFSPDPVNYDILLLLKARGRERATGAFVESRWLDITSPLLDALHERRISSLGSLVHLHTMTVFGRAPSPSTMEVLKLACGANQNSEVCRRAATLEAQNLRRIRRIEARLGSAHARKLFEARYDLHAVKLRTLIRRFPRFSERYDTRRAEVSRFDESPWLSYERVDVFR